MPLTVITPLFDERTGELLKPTVVLFRSAPATTTEVGERNAIRISPMSGLFVPVVAGVHVRDPISGSVSFPAVP